MGFAKYAEDNMEIMIERQQNRKPKNEKNQKCLPFEYICTPTTIMVPSFQHTNINQPKHETPIIKDNISTKDIHIYRDRYLRCKDCGCKFIYTAKRQKNDMINGKRKPKYCYICKSFRYEMHRLRNHL